MVRRKWQGDPSCHLCNATEDRNHLFFSSPVIKAGWGIVAICLGATNVLGSIDQYWVWINKWFPNGKQVHTFGLAAICWAIWKTRNRSCFQGKKVKHPAELVMYACSFMQFWAGLYKQDYQAQMVEGINTLLSMASRIMVGQRREVPRNLLMAA